MKIDQLTYKRAVNVGLLGLTIQGLASIGVLVYSVLAADHAAFTASLYMLLGMLGWLGLVLVYDQHRRERVEAVEAEALSAEGGRAASVFEMGDSDQNVAARRLAWMHKWLNPAISLLMAGGLIGLGVWRFQSGSAALKAEQFTSTAHPGWAVAIGVGIAVVGFIFARFVSGMAKQRVWQALRAGATQIVGVSLYTLSLGVAQFVDIAGPDNGTRWILVIFPIVMIVLGAEILINLVLNAYRPRRRDEAPPPAFDSRILGFVAAPDQIAETVGEMINYQFGFDVTSSWFYQLLSRSFVVLLLVGGVLVWLMTTVAVVSPNEQGLRVRFGSLVGEAVGPGAHVKLPWPLERLDRYPVTAIRRVDVGSPSPDAEVAKLWTRDLGVDEVMFIVEPASSVQIDGFEETVDPLVDAGGAPDRALLSAEIPVQFVVEDFEKFERFASDGFRERIIAGIARREATALLATTPVNETLGSGREAVSRELRRRVDLALARLDAGVVVRHVGLEGVRPPRDTATAFEDVVQSSQDRDTLIENGLADKIETLAEAVGSVDVAEKIIAELDVLKAMRESGVSREELALQEQVVQERISEAGGQASALIQEARAARWTVHMNARARAEQYTSQLLRFRALPEYVLNEAWLDMLQEVMGKTRLMIVPPNTELRVNNEDLETGGNVFDTPEGQEEARSDN